MEIDRDICYRAITSRDARFDGRFFTGVKTTGIYCRPVCPATTPRLRNVTFFSCAAAEKAGFRPCKRCRPETSPGTPAWLGTSATVSRAMRYINDGFLDQANVEDLALRLGMGPRHLLRLFEDHLGTTPVAVAQTRRVHFARNLLEQSDLPMIQVALAAGFGSVRRFNDLIKKTFGATPTQLRAKSPRPSGLNYRLAYRPPYDWKRLIAFLSDRAIPGVEEVTDSAYRRTLTPAGVLEVAPVAGANHLQMRLDLPGYEGAIAIVARVRRMFDCGADPQVIGEHLSKDRWLRPLVRKRPGLRLPSAFDPFETAVRAILGQQISVKGATTISGRLVRRCGTPLENPVGALTHTFPTPEAIAAADLDGLGLTAARVAALRSFAGAVRDDPQLLNAPDGPDAFVEKLVTLPGIGPWTAQVVAMRALGEPDAFPGSDLGISKAIGRLDPDGGTDLADRAERWRPWRAYAALQLWNSLEDKR